MKIKILHLATDSHIAGTERLLLEFGEKCKRDVFDMHFCTLSKRGIFHKKMEEIGHQTYSLGLERLPAIPVAYLRLLDLFKKERFDIVHTHLFLSSFLGLLAARFTKVPFKIMTRHYSDYMYLFGNLWKVRMDRYSLRLCDKVVSVSNAVARVIIERDKIDPRKVITIHNGIDPDKFVINEAASALIKTQLKLDSYRIVGAVGNLQPRKGHTFLIKAIPLVINQVPRVKFVIAGAGPLLNSLRRQARRMNLDAYVLFCGYRDDIAKIISTFDVFVQPSLEEGFGISILEALAMGKPIVASCVGGIPEIISGANYSRLVPPADVNALARAIVDALNDKLDFVKLRSKGAEIIRAYFNAKVMVQKYEQLYQDLMSGKKDVSEIT